jgi:signal transduction histidine kinase
MPTTLRTILWLSAYVLASFVGRFVVVEPDKIGVIWPAAGLGLAWLACSRGRRLWVDALLMWVATAGVLALTDRGLVSSLLSLSVVLQTVLALWLLRRFVPGIWGTGGRVPFATAGQFGRILGCLVAAVLAAQVARSLVGLVLIPDEMLDLVVARVGRQVAALSTIGVVGLLVGGWLAQRRDSGLPPASLPSRSDLLHLLGVNVLTALVLVGFWRDPEIPTTYALSLSVVWAALRFRPLTTAIQCLVTGGGAVVMTIGGYGPIANVDATETRALVAQIFVVVLMITGLTISFIRLQVTETIMRLESSEAALALRAGELDIVLSHLEDGVGIIEETGEVIHANLAMRGLLDPRRSGGDVQGRGPDVGATELYRPDGRLLMPEERPFARAFGGEIVEAEEFHRRAEDGSYRVLEISAFPIPGPPGAPPRVQEVIRDVTTSAHQRDSLLSFAGTVAHDLTNPLTAIAMSAEMLEEKLASGTSREAIDARPAVHRIRRSVDHALSFVSSLLAYSVSRDQALRCESIDLNDLLEDVVAARDRPSASGEIVAADLLDVWADRVLLRQVLDNLIGNALKYVAPGTTPRVRVETSRLDGGWASVRIRDNGIGVPHAHRERVFESFHRATGGYQGTGLGLAICKRAIERHGGTIQITDNPDGIGTCFEFTMLTTQGALGGVSPLLSLSA